MADDDLWTALSQPGREGVMLAAVKARLAAGESKQEVLTALTRLRQKLVEEERDEDEDVVLEVMDFVVGWASPHMQL